MKTTERNYLVCETGRAPDGGGNRMRISDGHNLTVDYHRLGFVGPARLVTMRRRPDDGRTSPSRIPWDEIASKPWRPGRYIVIDRRAEEITPVYSSGSVWSASIDYVVRVGLYEDGVLLRSIDTPNRHDEGAVVAAVASLCDEDDYPLIEGRVYEFNTHSEYAADRRAELMLSA